ncbi:store-operated calcium entry regulator STIMATE isoform X3 [Petromyzon marinus]|uniref:store-operated calcium entry regulator STIMATE isoform X3 n=1 Tax=Petromyzon marinus TaxID=7757 RepID=UPI003F72845D
MNGPPGNASVGSGTGATGPVLSPITGPASNPAGRPHGCENGALMDQFGVFIQALLALVAFSTLMRFTTLPSKSSGSSSSTLPTCTCRSSPRRTRAPCTSLTSCWTPRWAWCSSGWASRRRRVSWSGGSGSRCASGSTVQELILSLIPNPQVELALVMLIVPFVVNAVMFWLTDNFLMKKGKVKAKSDGDDAGSVRYYRRAASRDDSESEVLLSPDESDKVDSDRDTRRLIGNGTAAKKKKVRFEMPV